MKAHKIEILVLDFEDYGVDEYNAIIEQNKHLNSRVLKSNTFEIGEWSDDHELNGSMSDIQKWFNNDGFATIEIEDDDGNVIGKTRVALLAD